MSLYRNIILCGIIFISMIPTRILAQSYAFHHLNTSNGLSDNNVRCIAVDSTGFLWVGTADGLNMFDGYSVVNYSRKQEKNLASNNIIHLTVDRLNQIWIGTTQGVNFLDGNRRFNVVTLNDSITKFTCASIFQTSTYDIVLYTSLGQFYFDSSINKWKKLDWVPASLDFVHFLDAEPFEGDQIIFCTGNSVKILDYGKRKIVFEAATELAVSACRNNDHEIAVGIQTGRIECLDIETGRINRQFQLTHKLDGKTINTNLTEVRRAANGSLLAATGSAGLVSIDVMGNIASFTHDPIQPGSISSNNTYRVLPVNTGDVIVGTNSSGANIFNVNNRQAGYTPIFSDAQGALFDNYLNEMAEDRNNMIWIAAYDRLIRWDRKTNEAKFYYHYLQTKTQGRRSLEIGALSFDQYGKLWVSAIGDGLAVFNPGTGQFT